MSVRYISQKLAQQIDEELMSAAGAFSLDQLMELAGLSCAQALAKTFPRSSHPRVLVCCGPGNQGGDGLVAARHLFHLKYTPIIYSPKPGSKEIYTRLADQAKNLGINFIQTEELEVALKSSDVVLDAVFGFSFKPPLRKPFDQVLRLLSASSVPILSIDIPSGWDVEQGAQPLSTQPDDQGKSDSVDTFSPAALISLTVPKMGVKDFKGRHWLGGRFVPPALDRKFDLNIPDYEGTDQVVDITHLGNKL